MPILCIYVEITVQKSGEDQEGALKVGVIAPLSGALAEYGLAVQNGISIFQTNNPELANNLEFIYEDSQWNPKLAVSAFNKLRTVDKVDLVFNWGNPTSEAVAPIAKRYKFPLLAMSSDPNISIDNPYVIRTLNSDTDLSSKLCSYIQSQGYKKIGIVITENSYVRGLYRGLSKNCKNMQLEIIASHEMSENDFRTTVTKLRFKNYDALGVFLISGQISTFYRQLKTLNLKLPTFGTDFFESTTEIKMAKGGMTGAVYPHLAVSKEFKNQYIKTFNNDLQIAYAGNAYDVAIYLATLLGVEAKVSPEKLIDSLKVDKVFQGVAGEFRFLNNSLGGPHLSFPVHIKKIDNDQIVNLN